MLPLDHLFHTGEIVIDRVTGRRGIILKIRAECFALVAYVADAGEPDEARWYTFSEILPTNPIV